MPNVTPGKLQRSVEPLPFIPPPKQRTTYHDVENRLQHSELVRVVPLRVRLPVFQK